MNEVRVTPVNTSVFARPASSEDLNDEVDVKPAAVALSAGKPLPPEEPGADADTPKAAPVSIKDAVKEINDYVQSVQRDLHFSVDEESGLTVVRVRDKASGELIRQIPEDIFLNLAQKLKDDQHLHLLDAHG
ncbi:MAG: flagellar protein FlaG [Cellvibrionaceae bacterium]|nr:flagellar protein FlaG [Cellvibrionaceae bacterium]